MAVALVKVEDLLGTFTKYIVSDVH